MGSGRALWISSQSCKLYPMPVPRGRPSGQLTYLPRFWRLPLFRLWRSWKRDRLHHAPVQLLFQRGHGTP
nr:MAG TPA: hypothetical protein [Caudoviricetes sp.]